MSVLMTEPRPYLRLNTQPLQLRSTMCNFLGLTVAYLLLTGLTQWWLGRPFSILLTAPIFLPAWAILTVLYFAGELVRHPFGLPKRDVRSALLYTVCLVLMQGAFHASKQSIGQVVGFPWDAYFARMDFDLHGGDPWRLFHAVMSPAVLAWVDRAYATWGVAAVAFSVWCAWTRSSYRDRARLAWMLTWIVVGTIAAWTFASAGPIVYQQTTGSDYYAPLIASLGQSWSMNSVIEQMIWHAHAQDLNVPMGGLSAMPSMHVAGTFLMALVGWAHGIRSGYLLTAYALVTMTGSVTLGWHYAVDGYLGAFLAWGCWMLAGYLTSSAPESEPSDHPSA
jgi:hypothetical protein